MVTFEGSALRHYFIREFLEDFPSSQHRPVVIEVGYQIQVIKSIPKPKWNCQKADWLSFTKNMYDSIRWIPPLTENYTRFSKLVISYAKKYHEDIGKTTYLAGIKNAKRCIPLLNNLVKMMMQRKFLTH